MDLLVVGAGDVGRWFAHSVARPDDGVWVVDTDPDTAREGAAAVGGSIGPPDGDRGYDLVCVAVPMGVAASVVGEYAPRVEGGMVDVTGRMREPVAAMRENLPDRERLSLHPLFAPARAPGSVAAVFDERGPVTERVVDRLTERGNDVFQTTPAEHDEAMETVQAKAHTAILAFALAADEVPPSFQTPVSAALFDLVEQVTEGEAGVYADIQAAFPGADELAEAARRLADADREDFEDIYDGLS